MNWLTHRRIRRLAPSLMPFVILAVSILLTASFLSCNATNPPVVDHQPVRLKGVPRIRVRITRPAVASAEFGAGNALQLRNGRGRVLIRHRSRPLAVQRRDGRWVVDGRSLSANELILDPAGEGLVRMDGEAYRGRLRLIPSGSRRFNVINHLDLESYLAGVLSRELPAHWEPEAYRALAVAARSFALYHLQDRGGMGDWDVNDDQSSQVYGGVAAETDKSWQAVNSTHGRVLTYGGELFMPQYSSTCGGVVNGARVLRNAPDIPPLRGGQRCTDCRSSPKYRWPPVKIPKRQVHQALSASYAAARKLRNVSRLRIADSTDYGRIVWLDVYDSAGGRMRLRAADLRLSLLFNGPPAADKLYSMNCNIVDVGDALVFTNGRGFGHGVGLCQYGAQGKAEQGWTGEQILQFYYPQSEPTRAY